MSPAIKALLIAFALILAGIFVLFAVNGYQAAQRTHDGCLSANPGRLAQWSNSALDALTRQAAADQYTADAKRKILRYAQQNWNDVQRIVDAQTEFPQTDAEWQSDPEIARLAAQVAQHIPNPGSPTKDCDAAYPVSLLP